ncbi:MAG: SocA family protein [Lachnospiraceae bacterium]|nr:SocA family protein [Lachnospiraceae bacterium]
MATIFDVADWFLSKEAMTPKKVQKLCYYYKAWGLALYGDDLIPDAEFQAWVHGPVCPELYQKYKDYGWNDIPKNEGELYPFNIKEMDILESVWITYGDMSANALEAQTHVEDPWIITRRKDGKKEFENCVAVIDNALMREYYKSIYEQEQGD